MASLDSQPKPAWELAIRQRVGLPRHSTANDDARVLLRISFMFVAAAGLTGVTVPFFFLRQTCAFIASAFVGIALQQYTWYTGRIYSECWADEGAPVVAMVVLAAIVFGLISFVFALLLSGILRYIICGGLHAALWTSCKWAFYGSLFDGTEKLRDEYSRRAM